MSEENKNLFVELPEGATEEHQKQWQKTIDTWASYGKPVVARSLELDKLQKNSTYLDGMGDYAKATAICGGIYWGIFKLLKHFNKKKMWNDYRHKYKD